MAVESTSGRGMTEIPPQVVRAQTSVLDRPGPIGLVPVSTYVRDDRTERQHEGGDGEVSPENMTEVMALLRQMQRGLQRAERDSAEALAIAKEAKQDAKAEKEELISAFSMMLTQHQASRESGRQAGSIPPHGGDV